MNTMAVKTGISRAVGAILIFVLIMGVMPRIAFGEETTDVSDTEPQVEVSAEVTPEVEVKDEDKVENEVEVKEEAEAVLESGRYHDPRYCVEQGELTFEDLRNALDNGDFSFKLVASSTEGKASVTITNTTGCTAPLSLSSYKMYDQVLSHQTLFDRTPLIQATSSTYLSVKLPECMAQIDFWFGNAPETLLDSNPYGYPNVPGVIAYTFTQNNTNEYGNASGAFCGDTVTPPPTTDSCVYPESLGDKDHEKIGKSYGSESSLSDLLKAKGYNINTENSQKEYQTWDLPKSSTTIEVEFLGSVTGAADVFGYYTDNKPETFVPLLKGNDLVHSSYPNVAKASNGQKYVFTVNGSSLQFGMKTDIQGNLKSWSSVNSVNSDSLDHLIAFDVTSGSYIIAFEDLEGMTNSDRDFNDMFVKVTIKGCENTTVKNTPPVITLVGANPFRVATDTPFIDPGATSTDAEDGDLTSSIVVTGSVNASTTGSYILTYSVTDSGGLGATTTRTVLINSTTTSTTTPPGGGGGGSNTPPIITLVGPNPFMVATDTPFIDPGATSTDAEDGNLTSSIVVTGSVNASTTGSYTVTYSVTDSGGLGATTTRTVLINATTTSTTTPPGDNGGGGGGGDGGGGGSTNTGGGGGGGGGGIGGHRRDISGLLASGGTGAGQVLGATTDCFYLRDYLRRDWNNDNIEMLKLQSFLNVFEKETLSLNGTFDQATFDAVSRFQNKYSSDILAPWGHTAPTGFVYILTKKKINEIYCNTSLTLTSAQEQEIREFKAYITGLESPVSSGGVSIGGSPTSGSQGVVQPSATSGIGSLATTIKDKVNSVTGGGALKNIAVSLFGAPKGLDKISSTYLLILLAIILLATFGPRRTPPAGSITLLEKSKKGSNRNTIFTPKEDAPKPEDFEEPSAPIIMGPASSEVKDEPKPESKKDDSTPPSGGFKGIIG